jgi:hypothetical protein
MMLLAQASVVDRLLGLRTLSTQAEGASVQFANAVPAWIVLLLVLGLGGLAFWSYSRLDVPTLWRRVLGVLRWASLVLLGVLLMMPQLVRPNERVEKDVVVVMVDRSASMGVPDAGPAIAAAPAPSDSTRDSQARDVLGALGTELGQLSRERRVALRGFGASAFELEAAPGDGSRVVPELVEATAQRTNIAGSLSGVLRGLAGEPLAGIVLLSDGRSADGIGAGLLEQLKDRGAPVLVVPLGSATPTPDVAIASMQAPGAAFVGDIVPVQATIELLGAGTGEDGQPRALPRGRVELLDATGAVLDSVDLADAMGLAASVSPAGDAPRARPTTSPAGNPAYAVTLATRAALAGRQEWTLRVVPEGVDLSTSNNAQGVVIDLAPSSMRVAYFDGYPRWEYRYLKNLLLREAGVQSTITLLSADRRSIQEGSVPLEALPRTSEEWAKFDVVILGDLRPGLFTPEQLAGLRSAVADRGVGLLWVAGAGFTPSAWVGTELADLVPLSLGDAGSGASVPVHAGPVLLAPGPGAFGLGVMQLGDTPGDAWPEVLRDASLQWNQLRWAQRIDAGLLKPAAEVLAVAQPVGGSASDATPLFVTMRYGAGRVVYAGTDETWRLRFGRGETLTERIWVPLVRLLAKGSFARLGKPATLEASPSQGLTNQPVRIVARLLDQTLLDARPASLSVRVSFGEGGASGSVGSATLSLAPVSAGQVLDGAPALATFAATYVPEQPGEYVVQSDDPLLAQLGLEARFRVSLPEDELRRPQADHALLASLADATGGRVLLPTDILAGKVQLASLLPNRERRTLTAPDIETLWDKPLPWALLIALLALEWVIRRLVRLS